MAEADELRKALNKAYRLLGVRSRSGREIRQKLRDKGIAEPVLEKAMERLAELNYLDDAAFACQWARNLAVNKLYGNRRIEMSLREKGISEAVVDAAIAQAREELSEQAAVERLIIRKAQRRRGDEGMDVKEKHRLYQWIVGKGFASDMVYERLKDL